MFDAAYTQYSRGAIGEAHCFYAGLLFVSDFVGGSSLFVRVGVFMIFCVIFVNRALF
jgi:hypothetical protein